MKFIFENNSRDITKISDLRPFDVLKSDDGFVVMAICIYNLQSNQAIHINDFYFGFINLHNNGGRCMAREAVLNRKWQPIGRIDFEFGALLSNE